MFWSGYGPCRRCRVTVHWRRCKAKPVCCKIPFDTMSNGGGIHPCWSIPHDRKKGMSNSDILIAALRGIPSDMWGAKLRFWLSHPNITGLPKGDILSAIDSCDLDDDAKHNIIRGVVGDLWVDMFRKGSGNDPDERRKIEVAAVTAVRKYYESKAFVVDSVETENKGWDLEISKCNRVRYRVEVKGTKRPNIHVELTPNEYDKSKKSGYRLAVVRNALARESALVCAIYARSNQIWKWAEGNDLSAPRHLEMEERPGAVVKQGK